jgi:signal transduction histidine kinase
MSLRLRLALALMFAAIVPMGLVIALPLLNARTRAADEARARLEQARRQAALLVERERAETIALVERAAVDLGHEPGAAGILEHGPASRARALAQTLASRHGLDHLELRNAEGTVLAVRDPLAAAIEGPRRPLGPDEVAVVDLPLLGLPPPAGNDDLTVSREDERRADAGMADASGDDEPWSADVPTRALIAERLVPLGGESFVLLGGRRFGDRFLAGVAGITGGPVALVSAQGKTAAAAGAPPEGADWPSSDVPLAAGWSVRVATAPADVAAARRDLLGAAARIAPLALLTALLVGLLLAEGISRPVRALAARAEAIAAERAAGPLTAAPADDEVRGLTRAFDRMLDALTESERRRLGAERVAAWQEVARRVAHEVHNALSPIRLGVENLRRTRSKAPSELDRALDEEGGAILEEVESLRRLAEEFSLFARLPAPSPSPCDLGEVVRQAAALEAARAAGIGVTVTVEEGGGPHRIRGDADMLGRALRNVVANALDALEGAAERRLLIRLRSDPANAAGGATGRRWEEIEVRDTGPGFAPGARDRAFEPYFTTRAERGGSGLGLAIVYRIVTDHGGMVRAETGARGGAVVVLRLPVEGPVAAQHPAGSVSREEVAKSA